MHHVLAELMREFQQLAEAVAIEGRPDYFLSTEIRMPEESFHVPLVRGPVTYLPRVVREVTLRTGSQDGPIVFREQVGDLAGACRAIMEGVELGVGEALLRAPFGHFGNDDLLTSTWRTWLWSRCR